PSAFCNLHSEFCILLSPTHAHILESHRAQADGVEQVLSVHDDWPFQQVLDLIEIKGTKFRPAGANYQSVDAFGRGVRGLAVTNRAVELRLSFWNGHRIVGTNTGALCNQTLRLPTRRTADDVISVRLE